MPSELLIRPYRFSVSDQDHFDAIRSGFNRQPRCRTSRRTQRAITFQFLFHNRFRFARARARRSGEKEEATSRAGFDRRNAHCDLSIAATQTAGRNGSKQPRTLIFFPRCLCNKPALARSDSSLPSWAAEKNPNKVWMDNPHQLSLSVCVSVSSTFFLFSSFYFGSGGDAITLTFGREHRGHGPWPLKPSAPSVFPVSRHTKHRYLRGRA